MLYQYTVNTSEYLHFPSTVQTQRPLLRAANATVKNAYSLTGWQCPKETEKASLWSLWTVENKKQNMLLRHMRYSIIWFKFIIDYVFFATAFLLMMIMFVCFCVYTGHFGAAVWKVLENGGWRCCFTNGPEWQVSVCLQQFHHPSLSALQKCLTQSLLIRKFDLDFQNNWWYLWSHEE